MKLDRLNAREDIIMMNSGHLSELGLSKQRQNACYQYQEAAFIVVI